MELGSHPFLGKGRFTPGKNVSLSWWFTLSVYRFFFFFWCSFDLATRFLEFVLSYVLCVCVSVYKSNGVDCLQRGDCRISSTVKYKFASLFPIYYINVSMFYIQISLYTNFMWTWESLKSHLYNLINFTFALSFYIVRSHFSFVILYLKNIQTHIHRCIQLKFVCCIALTSNAISSYLPLTNLYVWCLARLFFCVWL